MPRKRKRKNSAGIWISIFIGVLMVGSVFGVMFGGYNTGNNQETLTYGDYTFRYTGSTFVTTIDGKTVNFPYHPREVEHINISDDLSSKLSSSRALLLTSNYSSPVQEAIASSQFSLQENVGKATPIYVIMGFVQETEFQNPQITCMNATSYAPVMTYSLANSTGIEADGNCVTIKGTGARDFAMISSRIAYDILGVI